MIRLIAAAALAGLVGCSYDAADTKKTPEPAPAPAPVPAPAPTPEPEPETAVPMVKVRSIRVHRLWAGTIYANEVVARDGHAGRVDENDKDPRWQMGTGEPITSGDLRAETIYADRVEADVLEARVIYAHHVTLGPK